MLNTVRHSLSLACLGAASLLAPATAQAAWMGLNDGDYAVTLQCDFSTEFACPSSLSGSMSINAGAVSWFDFVIDGQVFSGDPGDEVVDGSLVDTESSTLARTPLAFLSLRLITDGQIGAYGAGDRWWVYCNNFDADSCTPNTTGTWHARALNQVPEPAPATLLVLALAAGFSARRGRNRRHRP